jgi:hypothetical protein
MQYQLRIKPKRITMNLHHPLFIAVLLCIASWGSNAAEPVFLYEGEPPYSLNYWNGNYIVIGGKSYFSGLEYQEQFATVPPSSGYQTNLEFSRDAIVSSDYSSEVVSIDGLNNEVYYFGLGIYRLAYIAGYRRVNNYLFPWSLDYGGWFGGTLAAVVVPRVYDIPVYLNQDLAFEQYSSFLGIIMKLTEVDNAITAASLLATNVRREYSENDNAGCATWYKIAATLDNGVQKRVTNLTEWNKLKPGITLVDTITYCPGNTSVPAGAVACAEVGGNRMILKLSATGPLLHNTLLHEIGHLMGYSDHSSDYNNLMYYSVHSNRVKITQSQCSLFEAPKVF